MTTTNAVPARERPYSNRTTAAVFHPMRGHVAPSTRIDFKDGRALFVEPGGIGWQLVDADGAAVSPAGMGAYELTDLVVRMDRDSQAGTTTTSKETLNAGN